MQEGLSGPAPPASIALLQRSQTVIMFRAYRGRK